MPDVYAGSAAARTILAATEVVATVARASPEWDGATGAAVQADALARRASALAAQDGSAFMAAVAEPSAATLDRSIEVPLQLAEVAADTALLAESAAGDCEPTFRADAVAATVLSAATARVARELVAVNLGVRPDDPRLARAQALCDGAADAARRALDSGR